MDSFIPTNLYSHIFRHLINVLEKTKLAYNVEIKSRREDYNSRKELPLIIHIPVSLTPGYIGDVAEVVREILGRFQIYKKMYFAPYVY